MGLSRACDDALEELPAETPRHDYQNFQRFLEIINSQFSQDPTSPEFISDLVVFYNIHPRNLQDLATELKYTPAKLSSYDPTHHVITLKMASRMHSGAALKFSSFVDAWTRSMGLRRVLYPAGSALVPGESKRKAPDASWVPKWPGSKTRRHWPSMVVEVAFTESRTNLENDIRFWLKESKGDVKIAVTITVQRQKPGKIVLEQWEFTPSTKNTRSQQGTLRVVQTMTATRKQGQSTLISGSFVLAFEDIFLNSKASEPGASDLIISHSDMEELAEDIWFQQFGSD